MQLKASTDYGLRAVLYLAYVGDTCSSKDIAEQMSIPRDYLIQLAQLLRNAEIIEARPGKHGGYRLARDASEITLLEVMTALSEDSRSVAKAEREERFEAANLNEQVRAAYLRVLESYDEFFGSMSIADLLR